MVRSLRIFSVVAFACAMTVPSFAASTPWDGTWKLNESKSKIDGMLSTVVKEGRMYAATSGAFHYKYACDGKDYPAVADRSLSCTETATTMDTIYKAKGKVLSTTHEVLSADGKTDTAVTTGTHSDGKAFTDKSVSVRVGAGSGWAGTWKIVSEHDDNREVFIVKVDGGVFHGEWPDSKESFAAKLDGTPATVSGPRVPQGVTVTNTSDGPLKLKITSALNGKKYGEGTISVTPDGKTLTETTWSPDKPAEKNIYVYEK